MINKDNPAVEAILGALLLAGDNHRLEEKFVRGITPLGVNIDRLNDGQWREILSQTPQVFREVLSGLCDIPANDRLVYAESLMRIRPDPTADFDEVQFFIEMLSAQQHTLERVSRVIQREYLKDALGREHEY